MNGTSLRPLLFRCLLCLGMGVVTTVQAADEALSLKISAAPPGATAVAVIKLLNPADMEAFSLELSFASGQTLSLPTAGWFSRGLFFPYIAFGPAPTAQLNHFDDSRGRTRVYLDGFSPKGLSGAVGRVSFKVAASAKPSKDTQVISLSGQYWSRAEQREIRFLPVTTTFNVVAQKSLATDSEETVAAPLIDTDGDGMPDAWEIAHGFNPNVTNIEMDTDNDGASNLMEYQFDTDPRDNGDIPPVLLPNHMGWRMMLHDPASE